MCHESFGIEATGFYSQTISTDSNLLKSFACIPTNEYISLNNSEEVFLISCVNPYLDEGEKYKSISGWEKRLNATI